MKSLFQQHKKGVSEVISYSLLIVIAVIVSVLVYSFLKLYIPKDKPECLDDVSLMIQDYSCYVNKTDSDPTNITLSLLNNGRFKVDAAYIRIGKSDRTTKTWINPENKGLFSFAPPLMPGSYERRNYTLSSLSNNPVKSSGNYILEVQPSVKDKKTGKFAACTNIVQQTITCT